MNRNIQSDQEEKMIDKKISLIYQNNYDTTEGELYIDSKMLLIKSIRNNFYIILKYIEIF